MHTCTLLKNYLFFRIEQINIYFKSLNKLFCKWSVSRREEWSLILFYMAIFPPTVIIRHRRENLKKCSLRGLEGKDGFVFYRYPDGIPLVDFSEYVLLDIDGEPLSSHDAHKGLFLIDATWRLAGKMLKTLAPILPKERRSIPLGVRTAYPRRQQDCIDPSAGLASIEALYVAHIILGRPVEDLLNQYHWKDIFLSMNSLTSMAKNGKII